MEQDPPDVLDLQLLQGHRPADRRGSSRAGAGEGDPLG